MDGLGQYFKQRVPGDIKKSLAIVISFDEVLNRIAQREQMDLVVRYEWEGTVHS